MRIYFDFDCPNCNENSIVDNGDISDMTVGDVEYVECCVCHRISQVPEFDGEPFILLPPDTNEIGELSEASR